jgi:hypothetical protein
VNWLARLVAGKYLATTKQAPPDSGTHTPVPERAQRRDGFQRILYLVVFFGRAGDFRGVVLLARIFERDVGVLRARACFSRDVAVHRYELSKEGVARCAIIHWLAFQTGWLPFAYAELVLGEGSFAGLKTIEGRLTNAPDHFGAPDLSCHSCWLI